MKYKILAQVDISGKTMGDIIEAEPHAMEEYLVRGDVKEIEEAPVEQTVEQVDAKVMDYRPMKDIKAEMREELKSKGIKIKGNPSVQTMEKMLKE